MIFSSCVKQLDFSQIEDFSAKPIFESSLVHLTVDQIDFFDIVNSVEITQIQYLTDLTINLSETILFVQNLILNLTTILIDNLL